MAGCQLVPDPGQPDLARAAAGAARAFDKNQTAAPASRPLPRSGAVCLGAARSLYDLCSPLCADDREDRLERQLFLGAVRCTQPGDRICDRLEPPAAGLRSALSSLSPAG